MVSGLLGKMDPQVRRMLASMGFDMEDSGNALSGVSPKREEGAPGDEDRPGPIQDRKRTLTES